jgi:hypothetical protein
MSEKHNSVIAVIGIDIGKNSFHVVGLDGRGAIALRQKWSRGQVETRLANMPACLIGMEACVGAHHLSRRLRLLGHDARLMPAKYVRAYSKGQKNDFRDAVHQRPRLRRLAGSCPQTVFDERPHGPRQDIEARQSLRAGPVRSGGLGRTDQIEELAALPAQTLDRSGQEAAAPQCAGDRTRQQAGAHRMERSRRWPQLRGEQGC